MSADEAEITRRMAAEAARRCEEPADERDRLARRAEVLPEPMGRALYDAMHSLRRAADTPIG